MDTQARQRLKQAREQAGLSRSQAARLLMVAVQEIEMWEESTFYIGPVIFQKMCEVYDVDETWVETGVNPAFDRAGIVESKGFAQLADRAPGDAAHLLEFMESLRQEPHSHEITIPDEDKPNLFLKALLMGIRCKIGQYVFLLDTEYHLCVVGWNHTENKEALLRWGMSMCDISDFIHLAHSATDEETIIIAANTALNTGG